MTRSFGKKFKSSFERKTAFKGLTAAENVLIARLNRKKTPRRIVAPCKVIQSQMPNGTLYESPAGAWMLVTANAVLIKMPYPISTNMMWRAANKNDGSGKSTNLLSQEARLYKRKVRELYEPLFKALKWNALDRMADSRIVIQPEKKRFNFSNMTHPRYDIDNYSKPMLDALKGEGMLFKDDRIFISQEIRLAEPVEGGQVWLSCINAAGTDWMHAPVQEDWLIGGISNGNTA